MNDKINDRMPEEIKKGLECDGTGDCTNTICPYFPEKDCWRSRHFDAFALINRLQKDKKQLERERDEARNDLDTLNYANTELHSAYEAMKRERDAAVEMMEGECFACKHSKYDEPDRKNGFCQHCLYNEDVFGGYELDYHWQWRGVEVE